MNWGVNNYVSRQGKGKNRRNESTKTEFITQVSEVNAGRVTKSLSKEFIRTDNRILGALLRLDDFLMNPLIQGPSGTTPEISRNAFSTNQKTNEDDSRSDPPPEAGIFGNQTMQNSGRENEHYNRETARVFYSLCCTNTFVKKLVRFY